MNILEWFQNWYQSQCNGDWEHTFGVKINTIDNPGWSIEVNLEETEFENVVIEYKLVEKSENDWYGLSVENSLFKGVGDPSKLNLILEKFKEIIENGSK